MIIPEDWPPPQYIDELLGDDYVSQGYDTLYKYENEPYKTIAWMRHQAFWDYKDYNFAWNGKIYWKWDKKNKKVVLIKSNKSIVDEI